MDGILIIYIILLLACIVLSAFFCSSETAFISLQRIKLEQLISSNVRGARRVARMIQQPEKLLSVVLLGTNLANTAAAALGTILAVAIWGKQSGVLIATIAITIILLIFSETTPKTYATHHAEKLTILYSRPLQVFSMVFRPFVAVLSWIATGFTRMVGESPSSSALVSEKEIRTMISVGHKEGTVEEDEAKMLHNVFDFGNRPVFEVMVPRLEVIGIESGSTIAEFLSLYAESPISRFLVYQENMDNIIGILSVKDVLMGLAKNTITSDSTVDKLVRPAYFTPETKHIDELFIEMRDNNYRMAVIIDEYGGTAGIVSLSRLLEEIVGPVGDEMAAAEKEYEVINEYTFQIDGSMRIEEANQEMELQLPEGEDYETVAGLILGLLGHIPKQGEQLRYRGLKMVISKMRGMKIEEIVLTKEKRRRDDAAP